MSYTTVRETALEKVEAVGQTGVRKGLHSLRASAAANAGVPDRCSIGMALPK